MRRFRALVRKEMLQVMRDPSALFIAFVLPPALLFLFAFAVSLDVRDVPVAVVLESDGSMARELSAAYTGTPYLSVANLRSRQQAAPLLVSGQIHGFVVIPADFDQQMLASGRSAAIEIITDGSRPNTANFVAGYAQGVLGTWLGGQPGATAAGVATEPRFWFNPELESRSMLVPGAIAIVMTMIGTLLTAMVVSREWERGTMESVMSTQASMLEIIVSKLLPYFLLGVVAIIGCTFFAHTLLGVPLRASPLTVLLLGCAFLVPALGQGLMISTLTKSQFMAAQLAVLSGFLPALLLSGFVFEIDSMPWFIQMITRVVPASYYVPGLQTVFLAGDVWPLLIENMVFMLAVGSVFFLVVVLHSRKRLD